jgi:LacI family transcriptional regulator
VAKLKDIAEETGFSIATISRVLNHDQSFNVSEQTRLNILSAAEKLNYVSLAKRHPSTNIPDKIQSTEKNTLTIGLAYWYSTSDEIIDPYYLSIRLAIEAYCESHHLALKLFYLHEKSYDDIKQANLDGLIALGKYSDSEINALHALNSNFVLVDCYTKHPEIDVVMVDLKEATKDIINYLHQTGVSSIGFIGGIEETIDGKALEDIRLKTFTKYEKADYDTIYLGAFSADSGYEIMNNIIKSGHIQPAYIVASDAIAVGCLKALNENKIKVPNEVSIISYNNIALSQYTIPALTTVDLNTHHLGTAAAETIFERINTRRRLAKKIFIPTEMVKRESSL